jgi:hypothetical protein
MVDVGLYRDRLVAALGFTRDVNAALRQRCWNVTRAFYRINLLPPFGLAIRFVIAGATDQEPRPGSSVECSAGPHGDADASVSESAGTA